MEYLKKEELNQILDRINGWIENCDSKVSTILGGIGVFAGILLATDYVSKIVSILRFMFENINVWKVLFLVACFLSLGLLIYGAFLLVCVLFAKVDSSEFERRGVKAESIIFFSSIAKNKTLSKYKAKLKKCTLDQIADDLASQIYICSLICDRKFEFYNKGLRISLIGFCLFVIMIIIGVVVS